MGVLCRAGGRPALVQTATLSLFGHLGKIFREPHVHKCIDPTNLADLRELLTAGKPRDVSNSRSWPSGYVSRKIR